VNAPDDPIRRCGELAHFTRLHFAIRPHNISRFSVRVHKVRGNPVASKSLERGANSVLRRQASEFRNRLIARTLRRCTWR
jgi:hypothetical protein